ncbi:MAG TPA: reverse transcriptase/maturase family protein [Candidatus Paceibacterota bacterium]
MDNVLALHADLVRKTYTHGGYHHFKIADPKPRDIHKAAVRDRLVHNAIYRVLYPYFDRTFIADSYSCRKWKGTHKALNRFRTCARKESCNHTRTVWVLKCDIRKFFASVDQRILCTILKRRIIDTDVLWLLDRVIGSFYSTEAGKGLPLGNLTSQLLVNIYMNEFDQFMKHELKARHYIRYADDFVILSRDRGELEVMLPKIATFLHDSLKLTLHPQKVSITTVASGVDFLGWVYFPDHRVLRTVTKRRALRCMRKLEADSPTVRSYLGLMSHGNARKMGKEVENVLT